MNYKNGYLAMFGELTKLLELLETIDRTKEGVNIPHCLQQIQQRGEEACIAKPEDCPAHG